jgi:hypothetical protein
MGLGEARRAAAHFERAEERRPDDEIRSMLVEAWLADNRPEMARRVLERMTAPPTLLRAGVLRAEGRVLEARETLEHAARDPTADEHEAVMCALIDLLEVTSDLQRLRRILAPADTRHPAVLARAGLAWLAMGAFHTAVVLMARLARVPGYRADALVVLMVAAAMANRPRLAGRALGRLRCIGEPIDQKAVAEAWGRGLLGRVLVDQCSTRKAGSDPQAGRLQQLLRDASQVFEEALAAGGPLPERQHRDLRQHLAVCCEVSAQLEDDGEPPAPRSGGLPALTA